MRWIEEYEAEEDMKKQSSLRFFILEMSGKFIFQHELNKATYILYNTCMHVIFIFSAVSTVDTSGISLFKVLRKAMEKKGVEVIN